MPENLTDKTNDEIADYMSDSGSIHYASALFEHKRRLTAANCGKEKGFENPSSPPPVL